MLKFGDFLKTRVNNTEQAMFYPYWEFIFTLLTLL